MSRRRQRTIIAAGLIERHDNRLLIARPVPENGNVSAWRLPRGEVLSHESPEATMRRIAREDLSIEVQIVVGQPPFVVRIDGVEVEMRYFFCGISGGTLASHRYTELRWVGRDELDGVPFDEYAKPVIDWLMDSA